MTDIDNNVQKRKQNNETNDNDNDKDNKKIKLNENKNQNSGDGREREERPFDNLEIADYEPLFHTKRELCKTCNKTFKNFCYNCLTVFDSVKQYIPNVKLPLPLDMYVCFSLVFFSI